MAVWIQTFSTHCNFSSSILTSIYKMILEHPVTIVLTASQPVMVLLSSWEDLMTWSVQFVWKADDLSLSDWPFYYSFPLMVPMSTSYRSMFCMCIFIYKLKYCCASDDTERLGQDLDIIMTIVRFKFTIGQCHYWDGWYCSVSITKSMIAVSVRKDILFLC